MSGGYRLVTKSGEQYRLVRVLVLGLWRVMGVVSARVDDGVGVGRGWRWGMSI